MILNIEMKQRRLDQTLHNAASDLGMCRLPIYFQNYIIAYLG